LQSRQLAASAVAECRLFKPEKTVVAAVVVDRT
jgi:hypothetical protein